MKNFIKKGITSLLLVVMMLSVSLPTMVNATNDNINNEIVISNDDAEPTEAETPREYIAEDFKDLAKNTNIKFVGKTYKPLDYNCKLSNQGNFAEEKEATFIKVNKFLGTIRSITVNVDGKSATIKPNQVTYIEPNVQNTDENKYTINDMKLNTIIYFTGNVYGSMDYSCIRGVKQTFEKETAGIVWKINKLYGNNSITVQLSNGIFRTVPVDQVVYGIQRQYITIEHSSLQETINGKFSLGIIFDGETTQVKIDNKANAVFSLENGVLTAGASDGCCRVTITEKGDSNKTYDFDIIKDASGNIQIGFGNAAATLEGNLLNIIKAGGQAKISIEDNVINVGLETKAVSASKGTELYDAKVEASYDLNKITDSDNDINAGGSISILGNQLINKEKSNTRILKTLKIIASKFLSTIKK